MTLLSICQNALEEVGEFNVPATFIGNSDPSAVQVLALANREVNTLRRAHRWQVLRQLMSETTTASQALLAALPSDFDHFHKATAWDTTEQWRLHGPATPVQWQTLQNGIVSETVRKWWRVYDNGVYLWPTPGSTSATISIEYSSKFAIDTDADGIGDVEKWTMDTDTCVLDEELITMGVKWRFLKTKGLPYEEEYNEHYRELRLAMSRDASSPTLHMSQREIPYLIGPETIPDTGFGS